MLPPGTRIGSFEILNSLGADGMGEVYRARDSKLNRDVAIRVLLPARSLFCTDHSGSIARCWGVSSNPFRNSS